MTTTLAPPHAAPPPAPLADRGGARRRPSRAAVMIPRPAEVGLAAVTAAAVVGMVRLFSDASFLAPILALALASHAVALGARRLRLNLLWATVVSWVALVLVAGWVIEPHTLTLGLPLADTWHTVRLDLADAWARFAEVRAPTPAIRGFLLACGAAVWVVAFAADTFAFRARARFEALAPSFVIFLFGAVLGAERHRLTTSALYLATLLAFLVVSEADGGPAWFAGRSRDGNRALVRSGLRTAAAGVAVAFIVAPHLPGAHSAGLVGWRDRGGNGSGSRVTVSPLVDIRTRLVDQSGAEMLTVRSPVPSYWRLTSLERFDGNIWASVGSYEPARGQLPPGVSTRAGQEAVVQQFEVKGLSSIWLPAVYRPERFDGPKGVRFDADSSSLLTDADTSNGLRYSVESSVPRLDADELASATSTPDQAFARRYLALPPHFPAAVRALADKVTRADAATCQRLECSPAESAARQLSPYHKARALQDWFRSQFTYDLNVPPGHDQGAMERFLFVTKRGYCEQFAGSFAAMARSLGLPSRVAVGFTPGTRSADGVYHVTDREAHAWPEVYLGGFGWVAFEPTPSRAIPGGESYTGVSPAPEPAPEASAPSSTVPATGAPSAGSATPTTEPRDDSATASSAPSKGGGGLLPAPLVLVAFAVVAYAVGVPLLGGRRRAPGRSE